MIFRDNPNSLGKLNDVKASQNREFQGDSKGSLQGEYGLLSKLWQFQER